MNDDLLASNYIRSPRLTDTLLHTPGLSNLKAKDITALSHPERIHLIALFFVS